MTVKELIEELRKFPPDQKVYRQGGEYNGDYRSITYVNKFKDWGTSGVEIA